jgi:hypothetical protein
MSTSLVHQFKVKDRVKFESVHGQFTINGKTATIIEIIPVPESGSVTTPQGTYATIAFPHGVAFRISFEDDQRETWCRVDDICLV